MTKEAYRIQYPLVLGDKHSVK